MVNKLCFSYIVAFNFQPEYTLLCTVVLLIFEVLGSLCGGVSGRGRGLLQHGCLAEVLGIRFGPRDWLKSLAEGEKCC